MSDAGPGTFHADFHLLKSVPSSPDNFPEGRGYGLKGIRGVRGIGQWLFATLERRIVVSITVGAAVLLSIAAFIVILGAKQLGHITWSKWSKDIVNASEAHIREDLQFMVGRLDRALFRLDPATLNALAQLEESALQALQSDLSPFQLSIISPSGMGYDLNERGQALPRREVGPLLARLQQSSNVQVIERRGNQLYFTVACKVTDRPDAPFIVIRKLLNHDTVRSWTVGPDTGLIVESRGVPLLWTVTSPSQPPALRIHDNHFHVQGIEYMATETVMHGTSPGEGISLIVLMPYDRVMYGFQRMKNITLACGIVVFLATILGGMLLAKKLTGPISQLANRAARLGMGEWPDAEPVTRYDELGQLQRAFNDMTAGLRQSQKQILDMLDQDPLTGLQSVVRFELSVSEAEREAMASGDALSLAIFHVGQLDVINSQEGFPTGDFVFSEVVRPICASAPEGAIAGRLQGSTFGVLLPGLTLADTHRWMATLDLQPNSRATVSTGVADWRIGRDSLGFLITKAKLDLDGVRSAEARQVA